MRKALEGPSSRKKTKQQTKQPKDARALPGPFVRDCGPSTRRARRRGGRAVFEDRSTRGRLAQCSPSNHGVRQTRRRTRRVRCGAPRKRKARNSRRHARTARGSGAFRRDARDLRTRTDALQRCVADAGAQRARRGGRCLLSLCSLLSLLSALSALCSLLSSLCPLSLGPSALSRRAPQRGPCCFVCCLVFFRELGPSNAFLIRKLTPYTPSVLLRPLILKPWY